MIDIRTLQTKLNNAGYRLPVDGSLGPKTYTALFAFVGRAAPTQPPTQLLVDLGTAAARWFAPAEITTPLRLGHALARWAVETRGFRQMEECLDYTADRLCAVWPSRFRTPAAAAPYAGHPQALANFVYGGRFGNTGTGGGWRYRGRGPTQLTFHDNYAEASHLTGLDLTGNPDLVAEADTGLRVACTYWTARNLNGAADADDVEHVCHLVQGGCGGLDDQRRYLARARMVLQ